MHIVSLSFDDGFEISTRKNCEQYLDEHIDQLLALPSGWLIYNTHGLEDEGWGPIRAEYLEALLERLTKIKSVRILPVGKAFATIGST